MATVRIPLIKSVETAVRIYYAYPQMGNKQIVELFGSIGHSRITALKELAQGLTRERNGMLRDERSVKTSDAYEAWGLDIGELERNLRKLQKLGFVHTSNEPEEGTA